MLGDVFSPVGLIQPLQLVKRHQLIPHAYADGRHSDLRVLPTADSADLYEKVHPIGCS